MSKERKLGGKNGIGGDYGKITAFMRKKQVYTFSDLVAFGESIGKTTKAAISTAGVMLSPRETSDRGDCTGRGNKSNPWGHQAYNEKLKAHINKDGTTEEQKFRFRFRKVELEKNNVRKIKEETKPVKVRVESNVRAKATDTIKTEVTEVAV